MLVLGHEHRVQRGAEILAPREAGRLDGLDRVEDRARGEASAEPWIVELEVGPRAVAALATERDPAGELRLWEWA